MFCIIYYVIFVYVSLSITIKNIGPRFHYSLGINRTNLSNLRIQNEIVIFNKNPPPNCKLEVFGKNNNIWIITWTGLPGTIYAGEEYKIKVILPNGYPLKPPIIYFLQPTPVHKHVYSNGDICLNSIGHDYIPSASISSFILSIISMLSSAKEKSLPIDNHLHVDLPPGTSEGGFLYHDDKC
ncbi:Ubiquitin-conjugating enzyme family protein [Theileria parva strain Muguga]|uniref:Ubiquitin-conjugating enzyme family protein n=1 Tax=Theileria parva strain Muguga TaxID=333668 RepID=UPI001C6176CD|nr:Ubiquitin-conjugating enzyme family protein [Theileria parva strain Muguga]KAF5153667.1 Ubiquitin-conjugating enzyme family protein [Theileria parva strain Muguga]